MKKIVLLVLIALIMAGCIKEPRVTHKYEVLLVTKDTMCVDVWYYKSHSGAFASRETLVFYDTHWQKILTIYDPTYIREIK